MKILIIILVIAELILMLYTYSQIRDICGHINDVLIQQDIQYARLFYQLENNDKQENKKSI